MSTPTEQQITERAYAIVTDAVNARPGRDGTRPPVPGWSAARAQAAKELTTPAAPANVAPITPAKSATAATK